MNFEHKDILIIGDSFCGQRETHTDWPMIISHRLTGQFRIPRGYGFGGGAWWTIRRLLLSELQICVPKLLVICHTEPNRVPNDKDSGINSGVLGHGQISLHGEHRGMDNTARQKIVKAAIAYYEELWSRDYCKWAEEKWFWEVDNLIESYQIPHVIHLKCFDTTGDYVFRNGITVKEKLWAWANYPDNKKELRNHLTDVQNQKLGNRLVDMLLTNSKSGLQELGIT